MVLAPPVLTPAEPPSGAFMLAAGLAGRGFDTGLLDLSLAFFHEQFDAADPPTRRALQYLMSAEGGYDTDHHRTAAGHLHRRIKRFALRHPGWKLTLMDLVPPERVHHPEALADLLEQQPSPFGALWERHLDPTLSRRRPGTVLISVAYLAQLPAAIDLTRYLLRRGIEPVVGGSLPTSLARTGHGMASLEAVFPRIVTGDGRQLFGDSGGAHLLDRLSWPTLLCDKPYLSARPIVPLTLTVGCHWNRCLFCPDRTMPFARVPQRAIADFMSSIPPEVLRRRPVIHLLDSAVPPGPLRRFLPLARKYGTEFYGFARPTRALGALLDDAALGGCAMLQLGVEGGSKPLLDRFQKGIDPGEAREVLRTAAAAGIRTYLYLLFGLPGETEGDRLETLKLVTEQVSNVDFLNLSIFNLPRYCELTDRAAEFSMEIGDFAGDDEGIRLYWPFECAGESPRDEARRFLVETFNPHPLVRQARLRTPRWFRAAHLALMNLPHRR